MALIRPADVILTLDAGNSRTKWGIFDESGELKTLGAFLNSELAQAEIPVAWRSCSRAVISNVAGDTVGQRLNAMLQKIGLPFRTVTAAAQACNVYNRYESPQLLGSDRWAALVAAWQHYRTPCLVVNAGTALTIDALSSEQSAIEPHMGVFLGGMIVPGFSLMQQSLAQGTAQIAARLGHEIADEWQDFPTHTQAALYTGALSAMSGAIESMCARLQARHGQPPLCILSGGDAVLLAEHLRGAVAKRVVIADNLVLQGLLLLDETFQAHS